jgi:uncharacterized protein YqeY
MLKQKIESDLKEAMKSGDEARRSTLRMLIASIQNKEIELMKKEAGLSDEEAMGVIRSEVKKRKDAAGEFTKGGRDDMAVKETAEAAILSDYLPAEMANDELVRLVNEAIQTTGAVSEKDFGSVMKALMPMVKGRAGGDRISNAVRARLQGK